MDLRLKRLSLFDTRLEILAQAEVDLSAQMLELTELREKLQEARVSTDLQNTGRARRRAPVVICAVA
jgi:hypothetical protein